MVLLVGGFNPSEKYARQLGLLFPIYGKMKFMFQTTKQFYHDTSFIVTTSGTTGRFHACPDLEIRGSAFWEKCR
jgi:hypothetical protein